MDVPVPSLAQRPHRQLLSRESLPRYAEISVGQPSVRLQRNKRRPVDHSGFLMTRQFRRLINHRWHRIFFLRRMAQNSANSVNQPRPLLTVLTQRAYEAATEVAGMLTACEA